MKNRFFLTETRIDYHWHNGKNDYLKTDTNQKWQIMLNQYQNLHYVLCQLN